MESDHLAASLDEMCRAITAEFAVRRSLKKKHAQYQPPRGWLKMVCYNAILTCMYHDILDELLARQERFNRFKRGPKKERSLFNTAMMSIFAHEVPVSEVEEALQRTDRRRLADEMLWGFRHYMEPSELVAFNRAYPFHRAGKRPPPDGIVPSLHWKVVKRRFLFSYHYECGTEVERYREDYPKCLDDGVERLHDRYSACVQKHRAWLASKEQASDHKNENGKYTHADYDDGDGDDTWIEVG